MAVEPPYSHDAGPAAVSPTALRIVSGHIELHHRMEGTKPERSEDDEDFWILGMANEDVPPIYKLPKSYAVYVIECEHIKNVELQRRLDDDDNAHNVSSEFQTAYAMNNAPVVYVGYTKNPYRRIDEHLDPFTTGAKFTDIFRPVEVHNIDWYDTEDEAKQAELATADRLYRKQGYFLNPSVHPDYRGD